MEKILKVAVALAIVVLVFCILNKNGDITNFPPQGKSIVAFGDSLVMGVGATEGSDFVSILSRKIGTPIINMGASGNTTRDGLARVAKVNALDPKIVLLLLGGNDFLRKIPAAETFSNLGKIIDSLHESGAVVIVLGVRGGIFSDGYESYFEDLTAQRNTLYVSNILSGLITKNEYMSDSIHPNNLGYQKIADRVLPVLERALGK